MLAAFLGAVCLGVALCGSALAQGAYQFATPATVHSTPQVAMVTVTLARAGIVNAINVLTQGQASLDFSAAGGGTCSVGTSYLAGATCTVSVAFQPGNPGNRSGAVVLAAAGGTVLGTEFLSGTGMGSIGTIVPGLITTAAGSGTWIYRGDGMAATSAQLFLPMGGVADAAGNLYLSDSNNDRIRKVSAATGKISTVAGNGASGFAGDGGAATAAALNLPSAVAIDGAGNLYIADSANEVVRRVDGSTGIITTVAGTDGQAGYSGDLGLATAALLNTPEDVAVDAAGNLYIADTSNNVVRKVNVTTGIISTIAGTGVGGFNGDGGQATSATLNTPWSIAFGPDGSLYIADLNNNRIRKVNLSGTISTVVGTGVQGIGGDGGAATAAMVDNPAGVAVDVAGNIYVADSGNNLVRKVNATTGLIATIAGNAAEADVNDGGPATSAGFYGPYALFLDGIGNLYVADMFHNRVREVSSNGDALQYATIRVGRKSAPQMEMLEDDGNATLNVTALQLVSNSALDPVTTTCTVSTTMTPTNSCMLGVEFAPTVVGNPVSGSISVQTNAVNSPGVIGLSGVVLSVDPTQITMTTSANPATAGASITFTVSVTSPGVTPTGTVQFLDGTTVIGSTTLNGSATTSFSTSSLSLGTHVITAYYEGDDNNASGTSPAINEVVKQTTTLALVSSANPSVAAASVTFTATISAASGVPTGTVIFYDGATALGNGSLNGSGVATFSTATLSAGVHSITANYAGDGNNQTSTSHALQQTVNLASTTSMLSTSAANVVAGTSVTLTAQVLSSGSALPTGTVTFKDGSTTLGAVALNGSGAASFTTATLTVGVHSLTAVYSGDADSATSTSTALSETVTQITTATTLGSSSNPANAGASLTLTATVTPSATTGGAVTGQVTFSEGATTLGVGQLSAGGVATLSLSTLSVGQHTIVAVYAGNTNYSGSTSTSLVQNVQQATTTTTLASSANPLNAGTTVTFTATVSGTGGTATGAVTFKDGSSVLGQGTLNGQGVATFAAAGLTVGAHTITAVYAGDANDTTSTSGVLTETVQLSATSVAVRSSANPVIAGTALTLSATVSGNGGQPTGTVTFKDGSTALGTVGLTAGAASLPISSLAPGQHAITAVYNGDANDAGSISTVLTETVQQATTTTSVVSSNNPSAQGVIVNFTATVTGTGAMPGGTVNFLDGSTGIGSGTLSAAGVASVGTTSLTPGQHNITAVYVGDTNDGGSTSSILVQRVEPTTSTTLTASANPSPAGLAVAFTAAVSGSSTVPTGTVTFRDGATILGTSALNGAGSTTLSAAALGVGTHSITASYAGDNNNASDTSAVLSESIVQATTQTALTTSVSNPAAGSTVTLTATVSGNGAIPGGIVNFSDGANALGSARLNASGVASLPVSTLVVGAHTVTAVYAGDTNDSGSTSTGVSITVQQASTSVAVTSGSNPSTAGVSLSLRATVTGGSITPTGSVTWKDGATVLATMAVDGSGGSTYTTSTLTAGQHSITATYSGDTNSAGSVSAVLTQTVQQATSVVGVASSKNPSLFNDAVSFTATVTGAGTVPTGTVSFQDGGTVIGSGTLNGSGVAVMTTSTLAIGSHSVVGIYSGDANHSTSQSAAVAQQVLQVTTTSLTSSANPSVAEQDVRFTATVTGQQGMAMTGSVTFQDGPTVIGAGTLNGTGVATLDITTLSVGQHQIIAMYVGDAKDQASNSTALTQTVRIATTQVALSSNANPSTFGSAVTFSAAVTGVGGAVTGTVSFEDGTTVLGSATVNANGVATYTTSALAPGTHGITALYLGDANNVASNSATLQQVVRQTTTTALTSSENPALTLDSVVLTATVNNGGSEKASGTVTFTDGATVLGTVTLNANATAALTVSTLSAGQHTLLATYSGDGSDFASTSAALTETVQLRSTTDSLTTSATSLTGGQQVTLISVVHWSGPVTPTGTVTFMSGSTVLGTGTVDATGVATLTVIPPANSTTMVANYSGDTVYAPSSSASTTVTVGNPSQFIMSVSQAVVTVQSKQNLTVDLTLTSEQGFSDVMKMGCLGLPAMASCTFSSDSVSLAANGTQTVHVVIDTSAPLTAGGVAKNESTHGSSMMLAFLPGGLLLGLIGWRSRKQMRSSMGGLLLLMMALGLAVGLSGCSGLNVSGTPAGTYAFKISASGNGTGVTEAMDMTLTVQ